MLIETMQVGALTQLLRILFKLRCDVQARSNEDSFLPSSPASYQLGSHVSAIFAFQSLQVLLVRVLAYTVPDGEPGALQQSAHLCEGPVYGRAAWNQALFYDLNNMIYIYIDYMSIMSIYICGTQVRLLDTSPEPGPCPEFI